MLLSVAVAVAAEIDVATSLLLKHSREIDRRCCIIGKCPLLLHCIVGTGFDVAIDVLVENPVTTSHSCEKNMDANANTSTASRWVFFLIANDNYSIRL